MLFSCRLSILLVVACLLALPARLPASVPSDKDQQVDLTPGFEKRGLVSRSQGHRGTCSVFVICSALEFALISEEKSQTLSVEFLNWAANRVSGHAQDGGFFADMWKGFQAHGICTEAEMPYQPAFDSKTTPSQEAQRNAKLRLAAGLKINWIKEWNPRTGLTAEEFQDVKNRLRQGIPVCAGLRWPTQEKWTRGVLELCPPEAVFDGHSVLIVGYKEDPAQPGGGVFLFRNSSNGARDGRMPYEYARRYVNDALWIAKP